MPQPPFRQSPSGPEVEAGGGAVESVFGRDGEVVAEFGDYDTDQLDNNSSIPGSSTSAALDTLSSSSSRINQSIVPGANVTQALDYLLANIDSIRPGEVSETFSGGNAATILAASADTRIGDDRWNVGVSGTITAWSVTRLPPEADTLGAYRLLGPATAPDGAASGVFVMYGNPTEDQGPILWKNVAQISFRARFDASPTVKGMVCRLALMSAAGNAGAGLQIIGFLVYRNGLSTASPNYSIEAHNGISGSIAIATPIPIDVDWHEFTMVRVDDSTVAWQIDGVTYVSDSDPDNKPLPDQPLCVSISILTDNGYLTPQEQAFIDFDTFLLTPT